MRHQLPRHDVRVVLHLGDQHGVARAQVGSRPGVGDEVDCGGDVARKDGAACGGAGEGGNPLARALKERVGLERQGIDAAMNVGVVCAVEVIDRGEHALRFL